MSCSGEDNIENGSSSRKISSLVDFEFEGLDVEGDTSSWKLKQEIDWGFRLDILKAM